MFVKWGSLVGGGAVAMMGWIGFDQTENDMSLEEEREILLCI